MHYLFIDKSGELGTKEKSSSFFLIAALCTPSLKALEKRLWKEKAKLYSAGWPKEIEIKGTSVWGSPHNNKIPKSISDNRTDILDRIIVSICNGESKLHYSIANKKHLSPTLLAADYGIAYNYLCGTLVCRAYKGHFSGPLEIVVDQRNKESHSKLKFDGYLETKLVGDCAHSEHLTIAHAESHDVLGLQAVDFLSWGLFRHYEHHDSRYKGIISPIVGYRDDWYSSKK